MDWSEAVPSPSAYMDTLIKKVEVLLSQLKPILPDDQIQVSEVDDGDVQLIFGSILSELTLFFISRFESINPNEVPLIGRERLEIDVDIIHRIVGDIMCLLAVFRSIPGIPERGMTLENAVRTRFLYDQDTKKESEDATAVAPEGTES